MADPFATGLLTLFAGPRSVAAIYTPDGGEPRPDPIRVIQSQPDAEVSFGSGAIVQGTNVFLVRRSDVPDLGAGDTLTIAGVVYELLGEAMTGAEGLTWRIGGAEA